MQGWITKTCNIHKKFNKIVLMVIYPDTENSISFSVIIPLFNKEKSISSTIESVLNQNYKFFELIIINDGSTDNSLGVAKSFQDERIRIISKPNGGVSSARNFGVNLAKSDIIIFLDADDLWIPEALTEFVALMTEFPEADVFAANFSILKNTYYKVNKRYIVEDYFYNSCISLVNRGSPLLITGSVAIRKECFIEVGGYNLIYTRGEDLDLWNRLATRYCIAKSETVILYYRQDTENRASKIIEGNKANFYNKYPKRKQDINNKFQKIYYGLNCLADIRYFLVHLKDFNSLVRLIKYYDWILQALSFIFKIKYSKY